MSISYEAHNYATISILHSPRAQIFSSAHHVLKHPESMFIPQCQGLSFFLAIQKASKTSFVYPRIFVSRLEDGKRKYSELNCKKHIPN